MARTRQTQRNLRQPYKRTSWTRFHLPRGQDWPTWSTGHSDAHRGPLTDVAGCQKVWLGRKVDDPEQAALIVLWESAESLNNFQGSPACLEFLRGLPEDDTQAALVSGALLRGLSLGGADDAPSSSSSSAAPSRFLVFEWMQSSDFEEDLQGRVTLTALGIPYPDSLPDDPESWRGEVRSAVYGAFGNEFLPAGGDDLRVRSTREQGLLWNLKAWAWADIEGARAEDGDLCEPGQQAATAAGNKSGARAVFCEFRRWNGRNRATPEREEASAKSPLARESWARTVAKVMPPVTAWEQERWDIQLAPFPEEEEDGEEEEEHDAEWTRNLEEFIEWHRSKQLS